MCDKAVQILSTTFFKNEELARLVVGKVVSETNDIEHINFLSSIANGEVDPIVSINYNDDNGKATLKVWLEKIGVGIRNYSVKYHGVPINGVPILELNTDTFRHGIVCEAEYGTDDTVFYKQAASYF